MNEAVIVTIIFASITIVAAIIGLIAYLCKRLEHKQILAAIEKGTPLSELRPFKEKLNATFWIKNFTFGIAMMIIGFSWWWAGPGYGYQKSFIAFVLLGVGVTWVIRGLLYRKYQMRSKLLTNDNTT
jgi:sterol desaturase/sphingolipid hydroxylase (fatty acid hydroxylase superfamily)